MKDFVLYIGKCDNPSIDIEDFVGTLKAKKFDKIIEILIITPTIGMSITNNLMPGSIMLIYFLDDIDNINVSTHCTSFLHRCNDEKKLGICLYATNVSIPFTGTINNIIKGIERACNIAKDIKLYNNK